MKQLLVLLLITSTLTTAPGIAQMTDTLEGFSEKISGEDINYFSPKLEFAKTALLTRCNGQSPIEWKSPPANSTSKGFTTYKFLMGHSTGTSKANRHFDVWLNQKFLFTIETFMHQSGHFTLHGKNTEGAAYFFDEEMYDSVNDAFGTLYLTVPASWVSDTATFKIAGKNEESRDWLMIFQYREKFDVQLEVKSLIRRGEDKKQLTILANNPLNESELLHIQSQHFTKSIPLQKGYNTINIPSYPASFSGIDTILIQFKNLVLKKAVVVYPPKNVTFYIIHHSHNDIGYSHLQTEVEIIQNNNIYTALNWIGRNRNKIEKPIWHIESLWAVENFLSIATPDEKEKFKQAVRDGNMVLTANYANILTGLCTEKELNWMTEYARMLEPEYPRITTAMITDIPGITASGLRTYVTNHIPYLSFGPNYIESFPDRGDRVGGIIQEQGDHIFYWKNDLRDTAKVLVWTAGRGYSLFHGIADAVKQKQWEKRLSDYCNELLAKNYPYPIVQLRYTQRSDNGPVDTSLCQFVENWNMTFETPKLHIASLPELFSVFEKQFGDQIPTYTGEITPYWEDGAYSTAVEESQTRNVALQTIALEAYLTKMGKLDRHKKELYVLHRNIVLFEEHTWGAWCSISDPEIPFTTEQWKYKKAFADSALNQYTRLAKEVGFRYQPKRNRAKNHLSVTDFQIDKVSGGLKEIWVGNKNIASTNGPYFFFEPIYMLGINPMQENLPSSVKILEEKNTNKIKSARVSMALPSIHDLIITYHLDKKTSILKCRYAFEKAEEKQKESMHIALPFSFSNPTVAYRSGNHFITANKDQLPGSNKDFLCTENSLQVSENSLTVNIFCPSFNLYETGSIIDENQNQGTKVWKKETGALNNIFLYVLNNYWHTNFKAYQNGRFEFEIELSVSGHR